MVPGLVDAHTHPVWQGDRVHEFAAKLAGASYMDIHARGGGIAFTVRHTRAASLLSLRSSLLARLDRMLAQGSTLVECKSGYGLDVDTELKMLQAIHQANHLHPIDLVANFCAAHSVPQGMTADQAVDQIINETLPALKKLVDAGEASPTLIDVFMEKGVFNAAQTERVLRAGRDLLGLEHNFHGDELSASKSAELAGDLQSLAVSHLECISPEGIAALAQRPTVAVLLPTTACILHLEFPPAQKLLDAGVPIALGSDFNPNAHCLSMPLVMWLACTHMRMTMPEALCAATLNAAHALGVSADYGSIEVGKWGDMVVVDAEAWEHLIYQVGDPPIWAVVKKGEVVYEKK